MHQWVLTQNHNKEIFHKLTLVRTQRLSFMQIHV